MTIRHNGKPAAAFCRFFLPQPIVATRVAAQKHREILRDIRELNEDEENWARTADRSGAKAYFVYSIRFTAVVNMLVLDFDDLGNGAETNDSERRRDEMILDSLPVQGPSIPRPPLPNPRTPSPNST